MASPAPKKMPILPASATPCEARIAAPPGKPATFSLGSPRVDAHLGGGLVRGALHEVYAARQADCAAASGFTLALARRAAAERPVLLVRQDVLDVELGRLDGIGLHDLGLGAERIVLIRARDVESVLRAGEQGVRCAPLGAVLMQVWGNARILDLTASRRLMLAAAASGVPALMLRCAATVTPSAAATRWTVAGGLSRPLAANAPGGASFTAHLVRHRGGAEPRTWQVEWNRDRASFCDNEAGDRAGEPAGAGAAPLSRPVVPLSRGRPAAAGGAEVRRLRTG